MRVITNHATWVVPIFMVCTTLCGCGMFNYPGHIDHNGGPGSAPGGYEQADARWKESGTIVLSRIAPPVTTGGDSSTLMGFLPMQAQHRGRWLSIDSHAGTARIMQGDAAVADLRAEGLGNLKAGSYQVIHKQKHPVWHAPDAYFTSRLLPVPAQGSKERYRKGALGDSVVYFDPDIPIHSAPIASDEVGGIRLSSAEMSRLYDSLDIGSQVEIQ